MFFVVYIYQYTYQSQVVNILDFTVHIVSVATTQLYTVT